MVRCISCRSDIIDFVQEQFEGFRVTLPLPDLKQDNFYHTYDPKYKELNGSVHRFAKERPEGSFCHLEVRRAFAREKIYLQLGGILVSYIKYDWGTAQCTGKVLNNSRYSQLAQLSPKFQVQSPWFLADNDRDSLHRALEELGECVPSVPGADRIVEDRELEEVLDRFLRTLPERDCNVFLRRYWYGETLEEAARRYEMKLNTVKTSLYRSREKLRKYLEKEGIAL